MQRRYLKSNKLLTRKQEQAWMDFIQRAKIHHAVSMRMHAWQPDTDSVQINFIIISTATVHQNKHLVMPSASPTHSLGLRQQTIL